MFDYFHRFKKHVSAGVMTRAALLRLSLFASLTIMPITAFAQPIPATCDPDYYDVLTARTYLEGKRELETAQRIILKQDSVMEYSCFHLDIDRLGLRGGTFSESGIAVRPGNPPEFNGGINIYANNLENALQNLITDTLVRFLDSFGHIYLGGTLSVTPPAGGGCNPMNVIWQVAKCTNFNPNWWVTFEDLASSDIRLYPEPCTSIDTSRGTNISTALAAAYPVPATPAANGGMDAVVPNIPYLRNSCSGPGNTPLPTGVIAEYATGGGTTPINDAVCVQPGCFYNGSGACN